MEVLRAKGDDVIKELRADCSAYGLCGSDRVVGEAAGHRSSAAPVNCESQRHVKPRIRGRGGAGLCCAA